MSHCRSCGARLEAPVINLGLSPVSNHLLKPEQLQQTEPQYPLQVYFCSHCYLAQIDDPASREAHFSEDYVYFSSISSSWLSHAQDYAEKVIPKLGLTSNSFVVELASNDGYLLRNFVKAGVPCLGIEPTLSTAEAARELGIECWTEFFGRDLARRIVQQKGEADLIAANNVLAHVPDLDDFVGGIKLLLAEQGTATIEFPHLLALVNNNLFDTIYHEHYCYFSLLSAQKLLAQHQLVIADVELLKTHGGSYRLYVCHSGEALDKAGQQRVTELLQQEQAFGLNSAKPLLVFAGKLQAIKQKFNDWLHDVTAQGKQVIGYGAAAKATTFLNYAGVSRAQLPVILDAATSKQGRYIPGCRIPIAAPEQLDQLKPDYVIIFPWNIREEIAQQLSRIAQWGGKFVVALPELGVVAPEESHL